MKKVLFTADDFGFTKSVTDGIIKAFKDGLITHTGLMVNMPNAKRATELAKEHPGLSIGLHFNITQGKPVSDPKEVPSLVKSDGTFKDLGFFYPRCANKKDIEKEFRAQVKVFKDLGYTTLHVDGHHYSTFVPSVMETLLRLSGELGIRSTRMIDLKMIRRGEKLKIIGFSFLCLGLLAIFGISWLIRKYQKQMKERNIIFPDYMVSWELFGDEDPKSSLIKTFSELDEGVTEVYGHPGYVDDELRKISTYTDIRKAELDAFTDPEVIAAFNNCGAQCINSYELGA